MGDVEGDIVVLDGFVGALGDGAVDDLAHYIAGSKVSGEILVDQYAGRA